MDDVEISDAAPATDDTPQQQTAQVATPVQLTKKRHQRSSSSSAAKTGAKRRVSRVESLRNLFLPRSSRSLGTLAPTIEQPVPAAKEVLPEPPVKVPCGAPDVVQEAQKHMLSRRGSGRLAQPNRSISLENVSAVEAPDVADAVANKKSHFPYSFIRSRLHRPWMHASGESSPGVQQSSTTGDLSSASCDDLTSDSDLQMTAIRYRSVVSVCHQDDAPFRLVRRKRSFSLATLPITAAEAVQAVTMRSEESGYESDSTRTGSDSPRRPSADNGKPDSANIQVSFVTKSASINQEESIRRTASPALARTEEEPFDDEKQHRCCNCHCGQTKERTSRRDVAVQPVRSRHLPAINDNRYARSSSLDRKKWLASSTLVEIGSDSLLLDQHVNSLAGPDSAFNKASSLPPVHHQPRPASSFAYAPQTRQFKMLRLVKGESGELGIYIKKKPSPDSGSLGYVIAGIEPDSLADR